MENDIRRKMDTLYESHMLNSEKLDQLAYSMYDLEREFLIRYVIFRQDTQGIAKLKAVVG